ncbi:MAG: hypothetical protein ACKV2U_07590 [Bryobacteraceae bacterium]
MDSLFDASFHTARQPNPLFCHPDFLERLESYRTQPVGKRAALLLQRLLIDPERLHYKSTQGENKGWRRSRLGGSSGSHFYAWWAPQGALPLKGFSNPPNGALFLRDIRHHDDHSPLPAHNFPEDYLPVTVPEVRREDYGPAPWTAQQAKFAAGRDSVRVLKGHPGSGKTTALLHAADQTAARNILYLTYSTDLASLARSYFDKYCSAARQYHVTTFPQFLRDLLGVTLPRVPLAEQRSRFRVEMAPLARSLGPWATNIPALFDEFHAHVIGAALPARVGRFAAARIQRRNDAEYMASRVRFIGSGPAEAANSAATRLERSGGAIAPRFFPDLHLAWSAIQQLPNLPAGNLPWDCIAIDECQDLTPIETFFIARLAKRLQELRGHAIPVLVAGDEAQTVRPTDFEWGWLNDIFHAEITTPAVHKLSSNLRSPRQIAELINRVWDLYGHLEKRDRPSGQGWASIEDDATDQILYCAAAPGADLTTLLNDLSSREGLALVSFSESPNGIPNALSPSEIKGLDFHSVCVIDPGEQLEKVQTTRFMQADVDSFSRRLAIDQLRVAVSRPTERLIWLDVSPKPARVAASLRFLNGNAAVGGTHSALTPAALLKSLQEENLDLEERIQRCQEDARQYISIRPDLAWSRAHQAVTLLGYIGELNAIQDPLTRKTAYQTLTEVCFSLGMRKAKLSPELGNPNLLVEAAEAARNVDNPDLAVLLASISRVPRLTESDELNAVVDLMREIPKKLEHLPSWVLIELGSEPMRWIGMLERVQHVGANAAICVRVLPPFYAAIGLPDAVERSAKLRTRAVNDLIKSLHYREALLILADLPERNYKLEAQCFEGAKEFASAAESHRSAGDLDSAIDCYRRIPDVKLTLAAMKQSGKVHTAAPALEWVGAMQALAAKRPDNFNRVIKAEEKKLLESVLESALGVQRKKAATKKAAAKKAAPKKIPLKKAPKRWYPGDDVF